MKEKMGFKKKKFTTSSAAIIGRSLLLLSLFIILGNPLSAEIKPESGDALIIQRIEIKGVPEEDQQLIRSEMLSRENSTLVIPDVEADRRHLNQIGLYRSVTIEIINEPEGAVLLVEVVPRARFLPVIAMGKSEGNSFSAGGGINALDFPRKRLMFSGKGRLGGEKRIELNLHNPGLRSEAIHFEYSFFGADRFNDFDQYQEKSIDSEIRLSRRLSENVWTGGMLGWFFLDSDIPGITLSKDNNDHIPRLGVYLKYDTRDLLSITRKGWYNEILLTRNGGMFGVGESRYWNMVMDFRRYQPVAPRHVIFLSLLSRLRTGEVGREIPLHQDFHIGGTNTVRGWNRDSANGKNELIGTAEYRYRVMEPRKLLKGWFGDGFHLGMELALFADSGKAWGNPAGYGKSDVLTGYGFGLRLLLPFVNVIRFDFAFGEPGEGILGHFGVVPKAEKQRWRIR